MNRYLALILLVLTLLVSACTHSIPTTKTNTPIPPQSLKRQWTNPLQLPAGQTLGELYLRDDLLFAYAKDHTVYVFNRKSGQLIFSDQVTHEKSRLFPPVLLSDRIVFPTTSTLEIFTRTGRKLKSMDVRRAMRSGAVGSGKNLFVGVDYSNGGRIMAINLDSPYNPITWELMTFGGISAAPAFSQGTLFAASEDGHVYAVTDARQPVWTMEGNAFKTDGPIVADVKADDYGVYIASRDTKLYCVDRTSGKIKWQYFAGTPLTASPVVTASSVYQMVPNVGMVVLDKKEGNFSREPKYILSDARQFLAEDDRYAYIRRNDNHVVAVDRKTGRTAFASKTAYFTVFAENTVDATIYAANSQGLVVAIVPVLKSGSVGEVVLRSLHGMELACR